MQVQVALVCRTQHVVRLVRPDLLVRLRSCIQNTLFLAHTVGTISQRGLCDRERLSAEALDGARRRGVCRPRQLLELTWVTGLLHCFPGRPSICLARQNLVVIVRNNNYRVQYA